MLVGHTWVVEEQNKRTRILVSLFVLNIILSLGKEKIYRYVRG